MGKNRISKKADEDKKSSVYIKLEKDEAISSKKDILSSEMNLLKIIQSIQNYQNLRKDELKKKRLIQKKAREARLNIAKIQMTMPALKVPKMFKREISGPAEPENAEEKIHIDLSRKKGTIENQLLEIQEKLNELQGMGE